MTTYSSVAFAFPRNTYAKAVSVHAVILLSIDTTALTLHRRSIARHFLISKIYGTWMNY